MMNGQMFTIGTYAEADTDSVLRIAVDPEEKSVKIADSLQSVRNPSWILQHPEKNVLYCVEEMTPGGKIAAFVPSGSGTDAVFQKIAEISTAGDDPCHLSLDEKNEFLFAANYTSGSLAVFRLDADGIPSGRTDLLQHRGKGTDPKRQEGPHIHYPLWHEGALWVTDLGLDRIFRYQLDRNTGKLIDTEWDIAVPDGCGPRHFLFGPGHGDIIYILTEMASELFVAHTGREGTRILQKFSTLSGEHMERGRSTAAAIHFSPDGHTLFTSNRGDDSIAVFAVGKDGLLEKKAVCPAGVSVPRDFISIENGGRTYLIILGQESRDLRIFSFDPDEDLLKDTGIRMTFAGRPACIRKMLP